jgi:hypothetical protein
MKFVSHFCQKVREAGRKFDAIWNQRFEESQETYPKYFQNKKRREKKLRTIYI